MATCHIQRFVLLITLCVVVGGGNDSRSVKDGCFCKLKGEVDDCSCKVESLDSLNNNHIFPRLQSLVSRNYFRYFKVNLKKGCPFWSDDSRCALRDCHVDACSDDDVPAGLKFENTPEDEESKYSEQAQREHTCEEERELGALDTTISEKSRKAFKDWTKYDDAQRTFCELDDDASSDCQYVDLLLNPERYTGYKGASAHRIWNSIYDENCFKPEKSYLYGATTQRTEATTEGMCLEKRAFYRLVSGLHTSINLHLSALYLMPARNGYGQGTFEPNLDEFLNRFDPTFCEQGPQRLKNLYFTYLVELRALAKAAPYLEQEDFYTGDSKEDQDFKRGVKDLLSVIKSFPDHFDESKLFSGDPDQAKELKEEFRLHFHNISRIMDCVGCEKCRLWGKLQVTGMGTALKILFSGDTIGPASTVNAEQKGKFQLRRSEIVTLFNAFARLSTSIRNIEKFREMLR